MLSRDEVAGFFAFGFVVLRGCLATAERKNLERAYNRLMETAAPYNYFGEAGTRTARAAEEKDPGFARFVVHPKITLAMADLWGTGGLYLGCDIWSNRDDTPWHTDGHPGRSHGTVKVTTYLDEMSAAEGALKLLPGTHLPAYSRALFQQFGYFDRGRPRLRIEADKIPGALAVHTLPGDVIIWDTRLWHAAFKRRDGRPRRALFFSFVRDPADDILDEKFAFDTLAAQRNGEEPYYGPNFLVHGAPRSTQMAARLEELGLENVRPAAT